jgi:electron transport complex protein RnfG
MKKMIKSTIILLVFVLVSVVLIGVTYTVTAGPLAEQRAQMAAGAVTELMPGTHRMTEVELDGEEDTTLTHLVRCYNNADEFIGYVFTATPRGFAGEIEMMVALDYQGVISGLQIVEHQETQGMGSEIAEDWFTDLFVGRYGMLFSSHNATGSQEIDIISSATISTDAVIRGVNDATAYFTGEEVPAEVVPEIGDIYMPEIEEFWPNTYQTRRMDMAISLDENGEINGYVFYVSVQGYNIIDMAIAIDLQGAIKGVKILQHNESWNFGAIALEDDDFLHQFIGRTGTLTAVRGADGPQEVDAVSMATLTVDGVLQGVNDAIEFFNSLQSDF